MATRMKRTGEGRTETGDRPELRLLAEDRGYEMMSP